MIKILVFSDSHGRYNNMIKAIDMHPDCSHVIFCGDGADDIEYVEGLYPGLIFHAVKGNMDFFSDLSDYIQTVIDGKTFIVVHGHRHGVKYSMESIRNCIADNAADVLCFGHTHEQYLENNGSVRPKYLVNPGAAYDGDFAVISVMGNDILVSFGRLK